MTRPRIGATLRHRETGREYSVICPRPDGTIEVLDEAAKAVRTLRPTSGRRLGDVFEVYMKMGGDPWL